MNGWQLRFRGRVIAQHADRRTCVVEAFERGWVWRRGAADFPADAQLPELMLDPCAEIIQVPSGSEIERHAEVGFAGKTTSSLKERSRFGVDPSMRLEP